MTRTEQEAFWSGQFGSDYVSRNRSQQLLASNLRLFSRSLAQAGPIGSCIEFGANIGMNLRALKLLYPRQEQHGVEINADAARELSTLIGDDNVTHGPIGTFVTERKWDLVLVKGVLIHIDPERLSETYDVLHRAARRFIMICEYYNPTPVSIPYRGHENRLFKRDFCGEMLDRFPDLRLVDYGFAYRRDPAFPQDDINWFLLEKFA